MLQKLTKLSKLWAFQEKEIKNRCQQVFVALEKERTQVAALEQFYQEYLTNTKDISGLELKEKAKFCNDLGQVVQRQKGALTQLENELKQLQNLHNLFIQKISSLNKVIVKRKAIEDAHKIKQEFKQVEDLYRQFKQHQ